MTDVPLTAGAVVDDPAKISDVSPELVPRMIAQLSATTAALAARLPLGIAANGAAHEPDELVRPAEAAKLLGVSDDFVHTSPSLKSIRVRFGNDVVRVSRRALRALIERRLGRE
jgi:hypothetical protein